MRKSYLYAAGWFTLSLLLLLPLSATAETLDFGTLRFTSSGQSMWGAGASTKFEKSFFLGPAWEEESPTIGGIIGAVTDVTIEVPHVHLPSGWECHGFLCSGGHFHDPGGIHMHTVHLGEVDSRTGAEAMLYTSGRAGFNFGVKLDSGSVDTMVDIGAKLMAPSAGDVGIGEWFNLNPESMLQAGSLATNFPEISAKMEAVLGLHVGVLGQACFIGFGCAQGSETLIDIDEKLELLSFNDDDSPGEIKILGELDPALFQFGEEINIPSVVPGGSFGGVTITIPDIDTLGGISLSGDALVSSGEDDFLRLGLDLDGLALAYFGLPGLGVTVEKGIFSLSGDILDVDAGPVLEVEQDFKFKPILWVDLQFDKPVLIAGLASPVSSWSSAWDALPDMALLSDSTLITPTFSMRGTFTNDTRLSMDGFFNVDVLKASLELEAFGLSLSLGEVGPLYSKELRSDGDWLDTPPLFSDSYALGGFNSIEGSSFRITAREALPEPGVLPLLGIGLLGILWISRRRFDTVARVADRDS